MALIDNGNSCDSNIAQFINEWCVTAYITLTKLYKNNWYSKNAWVNIFCNLGIMKGRLKYRNKNVF